MGVILSRRRPGDWRARRCVVVVMLLGAVALSACAQSSDGATSRRPGTPLDVVAAFYPLQFVAERVGGAFVRVTNLTPAGAEPHDVELGAKDLVRMRRADVVVYLADVSPAVDDAVGVAAKSRSLDVTDAARLVGGENADRHFWLDPLRLADVADAVASRLSEVEPSSTATFRANAAALRSDLERLDAQYVAGLADAKCDSRELVTAHEAFGYLALRYGFEQRGVTGLAPDAEATASDLAATADFVTAQGVRAVYGETLASPAVSRVLASSTGAKWLVLDTLEGRTAGSPGDYLSAMRANLQTLRTGQGCT